MKTSAAFAIGIGCIAAALWAMSMWLTYQQKEWSAITTCTVDGTQLRVIGVGGRPPKRMHRNIVWQKPDGSGVQPKNTVVLAEGAGELRVDDGPVHVTFPPASPISTSFRWWGASTLGGSEGDAFYSPSLEIPSAGNVPVTTVCVPPPVHRTRGTRGMDSHSSKVSLCPKISQPKTQWVEGRAEGTRLKDGRLVKTAPGPWSVVDSILPQGAEMTLKIAGKTRGEMSYVDIVGAQGPCFMVDTPEGELQIRIPQRCWQATDSEGRLAGFVWVNVSRSPFPVNLGSGRWVMSTATDDTEIETLRRVVRFIGAAGPEDDPLHEIFLESLDPSLESDTARKLAQHRAALMSRVIPSVRRAQQCGKSLEEQLMAQTRLSADRVWPYRFGFRLAAGFCIFFLLLVLFGTPRAKAPGSSWSMLVLSVVIIAVIAGVFVALDWTLDPLNSGTPPKSARL